MEIVRKDPRRREQSRAGLEPEPKGLEPKKAGTTVLEILVISGAYRVPGYFMKVIINIYTKLL